MWLETATRVAGGQVTGVPSGLGLATGVECGDKEEAYWPCWTGWARVQSVAIRRSWNKEQEESLLRIARHN